MRTLPLLFALLPLALPAQAGQLRDYSLPSESRPGPGQFIYNTPPVMQVPNVQQMPIQPMPAQPPPRPADDPGATRTGTESRDAVIANFRNEVLKLDPTQRRSLADSLREKVKKAMDGNQTERAQYYMDLLKVVDGLTPTTLPAGGAQ